MTVFCSATIFFWVTNFSCQATKIFLSLEPYKWKMMTLQSLRKPYFSKVQFCRHPVNRAALPPSHRNSTPRTVMKLSHYINEVARTPKNIQDLPQHLPIHRVKRHPEIHKYYVKLLVLFNTFLLNLSYGKNHVNGGPFRSESTLGLVEDTFCCFS